MPKKWVIAPNGGVTNEPPWGSTLKIETGAENIMPTPLAGGQRKIICGAFAELPQGGSFVTPPLGAITHFLGYWIQFKIFNVLPQGGSFVTPPLGAITHFLGILDSVQNFQYATPKGLICETTDGGNYPLFGHF